MRTISILRLFLMKKLGDVFMTSFKIDSRLQFFNKALILSFTPKKYLPCFCQWSGLLNVLTWTCKSLHTISYEKPNFWPAKPQIFENHCKLASKSNWKFLGTIACFSFVWIQNGRKFSNLEPRFKFWAIQIATRGSTRKSNCLC